MTGRYYPIHNRPMMILTCKLNGALAWAWLVDAGHRAPADDIEGGITYTLEAAK